MSQRLSALLLLVACGKAADKAPPPTTDPAKPPPPSAPPPSKPQMKDAALKDLLAKGTQCKLNNDGGLSMDCPEYKAINDYAFQHQGDTDSAETCVAFLADPDAAKKALAAECLFHFNARGKTPMLGFALDAIDAEKDPKTIERIAWGIMGAEAVTAKLDDRVLAEVNRLTADPKTATAGSHLFDCLFPQYLMADGPHAPAKAQALALASLTADGSPLQARAFDAVKMIDDKPAVCAAIDNELKTKQWELAAGAVADLKDACVAKLASAIDIVLSHLADDERLSILERYDSVFELDAPTRAKIAKAIRAAKPKASDYRKKKFDEVADQFSKPPKPRK